MRQRSHESSRLPDFMKDDEDCPTHNVFTYFLMDVPFFSPCEMCRSDPKSSHQWAEERCVQIKLYFVSY
jgi:hypothetical protein